MSSRKLIAEKAVIKREDSIKKTNKIFYNGQFQPCSDSFKLRSRKIIPKFEHNLDWRKVLKESSPCRS